MIINPRLTLGYDIIGIRRVFPNLHDLTTLLPFIAMLKRTLSQSDANLRGTKRT